MTANLTCSSWRPRIPFTLLFGVATSVELLQARLLKSACQRIYGAQFDAVQSDSILETVFRIAVAASDVPVRLGGSLLHAMLQRQHEQVAGIQAFIASIKYAYMCHFYGNALSVLPALQGSSSSSGQADEALPALQPEHLEAMRNTTSYQTQVELLLDEAEEAGVEDLPGRLAEIEATILTDGTAAAARRRWESSALRTLLVLHAAGALRAGFSSSYADAMSGGIVVSESSALAERVRRMDDAALADLLHRAARIYETGGDGPSGADVDVDACAGGLSLGPSVEPEHQALRTGLQELARELQDLRQKHHDEQAQQQQQQNQQDGVSSSGAGTGTGTPLRSKYWGQNKVMRTTVIAQRVQLSKDSAALSEADKAFTRIVDGTTRLLAGHLGVGPAGDVLLGEAWVYESRTPSRDVLVPRPLVVFERALVRPQDYLACECCADGPAAAQDHDQGTTGQEDHDQETAGQDHDETGTAAATDNELQSKKRKTLETGVKPTMPATSILYQLYLETGSLINVADLWEAFYAVVGRPPQAATETEAEDGGEDERRVLVEFYRGLAELRALGFVKASKKKADHVAKLRWI